MNVHVPDVATYDLSHLSGLELKRLWRQHLQERVPDHLPKSILAKLLAYRLQEQAQSRLPKIALAYLKVIENNLRDGRELKFPYPSEQGIKLGCQLVREHDGVDHRVTVIDGGYEWNGNTFGSLSSVAKAITGTNWNGHRFFGLKAKRQFTAEALS
jgi:Protein of unknown function (DUF2924)